jgi:hypothetical protein
VPYKKGAATARSARNAKIDTRPLGRNLQNVASLIGPFYPAGCALGYRRGAKGGTWIAKFRDREGTSYFRATLCAPIGALSCRWRRARFN